ncbi:site-specific integrase [Agrococcus sp. SL85]|uniref:tyrosine-type recombinase/integrase n=1 Tax=Agrococcus sp. SL85 TaxID=2995141 RepID=UPI00226CFB2C|nr:site-specific integrase [Agrococcus sp. SL85]WAC65428.1 site-specific integrase [Agrococcus sp. SL85]
MLRAAARDRLIARDPSEGVKLPRIRRAQHAMQIPSPDAVSAAMSAAPDWFRLYIALCAFAGLRLGEASGMQLGDVQFLKRQMHVGRQVQRAGAGKIKVTPPKHGSERDVFIADELVAMIARHAEEIGVRGDEQWLFVGPFGDPPHQNTVGYWWHKTLAAAGLESFRLHDLRHFYASGLIAAGCDVVTVQRALGHAKATTTLNTYGHLWPTAEDRTRAAAADLMATSCGLSADSEAREATTSA